MSELTHEQKVIHYLTKVIWQTHYTHGRSTNILPRECVPDWVPCRIRLTLEAATTLGVLREQLCETNVFGAMFLVRKERPPGVYVHECEILEMRENAKKKMQEPHS